MFYYISLFHVNLEISKEYGALIEMCPLIRDIKAIQSASITSLRFAADDRVNGLKYFMMKFSSYF